MRTILLVDSDTACLESCAKNLARLGYAVIALENGNSALNVIRDGMPIDLVISDYKINGMTGLEMLSVIKKRAPSLPLIMTSGDTSIEMYLKALSLGVFECINKPVKDNDICRFVNNVFERIQIPNQVSIGISVSG